MALWQTIPLLYPEQLCVCEVSHCTFHCLLQEKIIMPYLETLANFRENVRQIALEDKCEPGQCTYRN